MEKMMFECCFYLWETIQEVDLRQTAYLFVSETTMFERSRWSSWGEFGRSGFGKVEKGCCIRCRHWFSADATDTGGVWNLQSNGYVANAFERALAVSFGRFGHWNRVFVCFWGGIEYIGTVRMISTARFSVHTVLLIEIAHVHHNT